MSKVFTVVSGKGGVGKSTFCANVAISLAGQNKKVLLIDGDAGLRSLDLLLSVDSMVVYDWLDIIETVATITKHDCFLMIIFSFYLHQLHILTHSQKTFLWICFKNLAKNMTILLSILLLAQANCLCSIQIVAT